MKKMTLALIALFAVAASNVDARFFRNGCNSCATSKCNTCETKCVDDCVQIPQCYQWRKVAVCPEKHTFYTCPDNCPEGPAVCSEEEKYYGGAAAK